MKTSDFIFRVAGGLFFSIIYLAISYLASYLSIYWEWEEWDFGWFVIGGMTYAFLVQENNIFNVVGIILNIGLILFLSFSKAEPQLWVYIMLNIIVCLNIIIAAIRAN